MKRYRSIRLDSDINEEEELDLGDLDLGEEELMADMPEEAAEEASGTDDFAEEELVTE